MVVRNEMAKAPSISSIISDWDREVWKVCDIRSNVHHPTTGILDKITCGHLFPCRMAWGCCMQSPVLNRLHLEGSLEFSWAGRDLCMSGSVFLSEIPFTRPFCWGAHSSSHLQICEFQRWSGLFLLAFVMPAPSVLQYLVHLILLFLLSPLFTMCSWLTLVFQAPL